MTATTSNEKEFHLFRLVPEQKLQQLLQKKAIEERPIAPTVENSTVNAKQQHPIEQVASPHREENEAKELAICDNIDKNLVKKNCWIHSSRCFLHKSS